MTGEELTALLHSQIPFAEVLGLRAELASPELVQASCEWQSDRCTVADALHGGYLMAIADTVGAVCATFNMNPGASTSTIESKTNFFRPVTEGVVNIAATPIHVGTTIIVIQTDVTTDAGKLVTRTTQTQAIRLP